MSLKMLFLECGHHMVTQSNVCEEDQSEEVGGRRR